MRTNLQAVYKKEGLELNFPTCSVFPSTTVNFGPSTACVPHKDMANDAANWCHIVALGSFDPKRGGHLILHDLRLAIEFPPGASILIPSALFEHSNAPIQEGELRQSFTQYCAGGLMRWVECGFRTYETAKAVDAKGWRVFEAHLDERTKTRVEMFSTWEQLQSDRERWLKEWL